MRGRTFALSQKELQRVSVISSCAQGAKKARGGGGGGASAPRQPRTTEPPPPAVPRTASRHPSGTLHLCRLQRSPPLRKTLRGRGLRPQPRDPAPPLAPGRSGISPETPRPRSPPPPPAIGPRGRTSPTRWLPA